MIFRGLVGSFDYTNNVLGRGIARSDYHNNGNTPSTTANTFGYNTFSEVTNAVMGSGAYAYNYDPIGNRQSAKLNDDTTSYAANGLNQYTNITGGVVSAPTYDLDGNMTFLPSTSGGRAGGEGWHCQWDAENRLLNVSNLTIAVFASYTYDHQSRRISKKVFNSALITQHSSFTYDGWNLIHEQTSTNTSAFIPHTSSLFTWGLDLSGSLQGAGGVGGLLSQTIITPAAASSYFPLADANGNAVTYLDNAGNIQAHYTYNAFGGTVSSDGDMDDDFRFRFSSKYRDDETGLYFYGYRFYDSAMGRWISRDPIMEHSSFVRRAVNDHVKLRCQGEMNTVFSIINEEVSVFAEREIWLQYVIELIKVMSLISQGDSRHVFGITGVTTYSFSENQVISSIELLGLCRKDGESFYQCMDRYANDFYGGWLTASDNLGWYGLSSAVIATGTSALASVAEKAAEESIKNAPLAGVRNGGSMAARRAAAAGAAKTAARTGALKTCLATASKASAVVGAFATGFSAGARLAFIPDCCEECTPCED